ncbi:MAG: DUF1934 domain-containing protein [Oscillospiraceae bacterium]|nr:DUF1934 domain-containing protein [Oscillospiraceae bacterium]
MTNRYDMKKVAISIKGTPIKPDDDNVGFELMTDGEYIQEDGIYTFCYIESELTGLDGLMTTFNVEPDRVVLTRGDGSNGDMVFSEDAKHYFLHNTPYGSITMGIDTHSITKILADDGGCLEIRYDLQVDNVAVSQNLFRIDIRQLSV